MRRIALFYRIILLFAFAVTPLLYFGGTQLYMAFKGKNEAELVLTLAEVAPVFSDLSHQLQGERGLSAGWLETRDRKFLEQLTQQRSITDEKIVEYKSMAETLSSAGSLEWVDYTIGQINTQLLYLRKVRENVDLSRTAATEVIEYYNHTIGKTLSGIDQIKRFTDDRTLYRNLAAYYFYLVFVDAAGLERAMGSIGFGSGNFSGDIFKKFVTFGENQQVLYNVVLGYTNVKQARYLEELFQRATIKKVELMRQEIVPSMSTNEPLRTTGDEWWQASTKRINELMETEKQLASDLIMVAQSKVAEQTTHLIAVALSLLIILALGAVAMYFIVRSVTRPVASLLLDANRLANGDTEVSFKEAKGTDEVGRITHAVLQFRDNIAEQLRLRELRDSAYQKDIRRQEKVEHLVSEFREQMEHALNSVDGEADQMRDTAKSLSDVASSTTNKARSATSASNTTSQTVQAVAKATSELTASVKKIAARVRDTKQIVNQATVSTRDTSEKVGALQDAAQKIGEVITIIKDIAEQTNLLALNATIEAARAGNAGKGFAVVASEVKNLASETSKATEEIAAHIESIQSSTGDTVDAISKIAEQMTTVDEFTSSISSALDQQNQAANEINSNVTQAADGTGELIVVVDGVTEAAGQTNHSADQVLEASEALAGQAQKLRGTVSNFLTAVSSS